MRNVLGTITHVSTHEPIVSLTFDDGPHPEFTPHLLDILESHGARGTFFVVGKAAERQRELIMRISQGGHALGNHSWDHPSFPLITGRQRRKQMRACRRVIAPYGECLFRPPYGHQSIASRLDAFWLGYQVITWNVAAEDWLDHNADWMVERVMDGICPGSIILFHDALYTFAEDRYACREQTLKAVEILLGQLGDKFRFVTVPQLLKLGRPRRRNWYSEANRNWLSELKVGMA